MSESLDRNSENSSPKKNKKLSSNDFKYVKNKRELRDSETYQQAFLLGILNEFCSFTIKLPRKKTIVTSNFHVLVDLVFINERMNILDLIETHCKPKYEYELKSGMNFAAAFRRYDKNRRIFTQNLLIDLCVEKGYFFNSKLARKSKKNLRREVIESVFYDNYFLYDLNEIQIRGKYLNKYFTSVLQTNKSSCIFKNDPCVKTLLTKDLSQLPIY
ncbi:TATA-binding protein-associated phosphoprotein [Entamoeba marina]